MPDRKITELAELTSIVEANEYWFEIVDTSEILATNRNKRVSEQTLKDYFLQEVNINVLTIDDAPSVLDNGTEQTLYSNEEITSMDGATNKKITWMGVVNITGSNPAVYRVTIKSSLTSGGALTTDSAFDLNFLGNSTSHYMGSIYTSSRPFITVTVQRISGSVNNIPGGSKFTFIAI